MSVNEGRQPLSRVRAAIIICRMMVCRRDAWYVLEFKRPGIQNGVYRKLRLGHYDIEARLDLHRFTVAEARDRNLVIFQRGAAIGVTNPANYPR